ncbi:MAG: hypothetical protein O2856_18975 [Planctomycetota bacterium]|nr:hypothetical protein [Planctomycetota bacterium]
MRFYKRQHNTSWLPTIIAVGRWFVSAGFVVLPIRELVCTLPLEKHRNQWEF